MYTLRLGKRHTRTWSDVGPCEMRMFHERIIATVVRINSVCETNTLFVVVFVCRTPSPSSFLITFKAAPVEMYKSITYTQIELSLGCRDLVLNIEVGWIISSDMVSFQRVCDWWWLICITHICEIQVRTRTIHELVVQGHHEYHCCIHIYARLCTCLHV